MAKIISKPLVLVLLLIILPIVTLTIFQLNTNSRQEQTFKKIYERQLKSVIFSINMYADDVVSQWVSKAGRYIEEGVGSTDSLLHEFLMNYSQVDGIVILEREGQKEWVHGIIPEGRLNEIRSELVLQQESIKRLFVYLGSNYRKVNVIELKDSHTPLLTFAIKKPNGKEYIGVLILNAEKFIVDILVPRMQSTARDDMSIGVLHQHTKHVIYSNQNEIAYTANDINEVLWQMPAYAIYLKPVGNSSDSLVQSRNKNNFLLLMVVDLVLVLGAVLIYINVRKQLQLAKIRSDFVSNVSHEIRTPLALISMYAESLHLNRVNTEEKRQRSYHVIFREAKRLTGIVNNILNFSKIESGKRKFSFDNVSVNTVIKDVVSRYQYDMESEDIEFVVELDEGIAAVNADKEALEETMINLIDNAIKYSDNIKKVEIFSGQQDHEVWFQVRDYGIGISKKDQKLIFNQFYRVTEGNLAHKAKGSGLGLNIVKQIIDAHNGHIFVDSEPGKGSSFKIYLPQA